MIIMVRIGSILMGAIDILIGLVLITAKTNFVSLTAYTVPYSIAFCLGIAVLAKGIYSLAFSFYGG